MLNDIKPTWIQNAHFNKPGAYFLNTFFFLFVTEPHTQVEEWNKGCEIKFKKGAEEEKKLMRILS